MKNMITNLEFIISRLKSYWKDISISFLAIWVTSLIVLPNFVISNMQTFLTESLKISNTTATVIVNAHDGVAGIFAIVGASVNEVFLTDYGMIFISALFYLSGSILLTGGCYYIYKNIVLSRWLVGIGLFLIAVGKLNLVNSAYSLTKLPKKAKNLQILINYAITVILLVLSAAEADWYTSHIDAGDSVVAHPQQFIYPTIFVLLITLVSLGYLKYEPFIRKSPRQCWTLLQYVPQVIAAISQKHRVQHTGGNSLVTDNGSAGRDEIQETSEPDHLPRLPCSSTKVEGGQQLLRMVPMCMAFLASGLVYSIGNTFFLDQAKGMDTRIGKSKYKIPLQGFLILANVSSSVTRKLYTAMISNSLQGSGEKYSPAIEYAIGMVLSALCCTVASWIAMEVFEHEEAKSKISAFVLTPQFLLFGAMDGLARDGIKGFFSGQLPDPVKSYAVAFTEGMIGAGSMFAIILVLVTKATTNWFNDKEGKNRVDRFYHLLTVVAIIIFLGYTLVAVKFPYQDDKPANDHQEEGDAIEGKNNKAEEDRDRDCDQEEGIKQEIDTYTDGENKVEEDSSQNDDHQEEGDDIEGKNNKAEEDRDRDQEEGIKQETGTYTDGENKVEEDSSQNDDFEGKNNKAEEDCDLDQEEGIKQESDTYTDGENKVEEDSSQNDDQEKRNKQEHRIDIPEEEKEDDESS